jgi:hypothetical protein
MKEIYLNNNIIAYSYEYIPKSSKEDILDRVELMIKNQHWVKSDAYMFLKCPKEFEDIYDFCSKKCNEISNNDKEFLLHKWVSILRSNPVQPMELDVENKEPTYHNHLLMAQLAGKKIPSYSFVYYFQMPNNLSGIDGNILFKDDDGNVLKYLPKENEVLVFTSNISHAPIHAKNSTKNRIVLAGDFIISNNTKNKTLI